MSASDRDPDAALAAHGRLFVATGGSSSSPDTVHTKPAAECRALARAAGVRTITHRAAIPRDATVCDYCTGTWESDGGKGSAQLATALANADPEEVLGD